MSRAAMLKTLKGQVLNELGEIQTEALKRAPKDTVAPKQTDAKVDVEGKRFENRKQTPRPLRPLAAASAESLASYTAPQFSF